jgi:hypothetical protein
LFLVDDDLFVNPVKCDELGGCDPYREILSLRLGPHVTRSYVVQKDQPLPPRLDEDGDIFRWRWTDGELDWGYPFSVDGHVFATEEIIAMADIVDFSSPTSFEENMRAFEDVFMQRDGVCFRRSRIVNIPCNRVQQESDNLAGDIHQDYLLEQWLAGMQMDFRALAGFESESVHQEIPFSLIPRE